MASTEALNEGKKYPVTGVLSFSVTRGTRKRVRGEEEKRRKKHVVNFCPSIG